jgi:hypothetical protein
MRSERIWFWVGLIWLGAHGAEARAALQPVAVSSLAELAQAAARSGQVVTMRPGLYRLTDFVPLSSIPERRQRKQWPLFVFSGSNNVFQLGGVIIEVDTALRRALRPPVHTDEFLISGRSNVLTGLTITNIGDGASPGGAALAVRGRGNTLRDCTLHVRGSFPYGYGDLFGKGGPDIIAHQKKSGVLVTGDGTTLLGCKLFLRSFGHGFFVQQDAADVRFEDCHVEGVMRATDDMLAETNGPAFKVGFRSVVKNRAGENKVTPGYMKCLSEDGFRTYGEHRNLVLKNCTAKNMRGGFELRTKTAVRLENCTATGCERAFWISSGAQVVNARGDAQFGPLLFVEGDGATAEIELLPAESTMNVHALAAVQGSGHKLTFKASPDGVRTRAVPILLGYSAPMMGDGSAPMPERNARNIFLRNDTTMPVVIGSKASGGEVVSRGPVLENKGRGVVLRTW